MIMDSEAIVKNIIQLKKMSDKLKQSTQNPNVTKTDLTRNLQKVCKQIDRFQNGTKIQRNNNNYLLTNDKKSKNNQIKFDEGNNQFQNINGYHAYQHHDIDDNSVRNENIYIKNKQKQQLIINNPTQQMLELKNQNDELEQEIKNLQQKLKKLQNIQKQQINQQWKDGLPYFVLHLSKVFIFYTKLTISQKDYDKIDYKPYSINLDLEKVIISEIVQPNSISKPHKPMTFMLSDLKQVNYHNPQQNSKVLPFTLSYRLKEEQQQYLIIYHFKQNKQLNIKSKQLKKIKLPFSYSPQYQQKIKQNDEHEITQSLFIKFQNEQQYKQWDLGLFINYKIIQDMSNTNNHKTQQLSSRVVKSHPSHKSHHSHHSQKSNDIQKESLNDLFQKNYNLNQIPSNKSIIHHSDNDLVNTQKSYSVVQHYDSNKDSRKMQKKMNKLMSNVQKKSQSMIQPKKLQSQKLYNKIKVRDESPQSPLKQRKKNSFEQLTKTRSYTSHFGNIMEINNNNNNQDKNIKFYKQQKQLQQSKRFKLYQMEQQKKKQQQRMEALKKMEHELAFKKAKESLKKGYLMVKYAKKGSKPHQRRIYISQDGKKLQWQDSKSPKELKSILIKEITSIKQGQIGKQIEAHLDPIKIDNKSCFVTIFLNSKDRKTLQLSTKNQFQMEQFCKNLQLYKLNVC